MTLASTPGPAPSRSKALAAWLAVLGGPLGLHRHYLGGRRRALAWLYPLPTAAGWLGVLRMRQWGQDDGLAILLVLMLGTVLAVSMLEAVLIGLTPDERWERHHGPQSGRGGWAAVLAVVAALLVGATVLLGTVAFGGQKYFERAREAARQAPPPGQNTSVLNQ